MDCGEQVDKGEGLQYLEAERRLTMEKGVLTIKGERKHESEEDKEGYHRIEREQGTFMRRFALPENVDADQIAATSKDGVVELTLPKAEKQEQPKRIRVV